VPVYINKDVDGMSGVVMERGEEGEIFLILFSFFQN